ncbi:hypothetical protein AAE478_002567 [Parahypoxylon ruwenzoriense]
MRVPSLASTALSAITYTTVTSASPVQYCPQSNLCYLVAVPETSASSNSGNIYLQLRASTSYSWVGFGTGQAMVNSNLFVMYTDGSGNVTISPRSGTGHTMPRHDTTTQIELLEGSGVNGSTMVANVRCGNCGSWSGGSMSLSSSATDWIAAWKGGEAIDSTDPDAAIGYHDDNEGWRFDLTMATVADDTNPFSAGEQPSNSSRGMVEGVFTDPQTLILGHGIIMALVMVLLFPIGSTLMPVFGKWILHALWQFFSFLLMWVGFGLGIVASQRIQIGFNSTHTAFGTALVCLMTAQPVLGYLHHRHFVKNRRRGTISHAHIWYGRALMTMSIINGGLGISLASGSRTFLIAYSVVSGSMFVTYVAAAMYGMFRRRRRAIPGDYELKDS